MEFLTNNISDYYIHAYIGLNLCISFIGSWFALIGYHYFLVMPYKTKEFQGILDAPMSYTADATVQRYRKLRKEAYELLANTISIKLDKKISGERVIYAVLEMYKPGFKPNDETDCNDVLFSILALEAAKQVQTHNPQKFMSYLSHVLPNL